MMSRWAAWLAGLVFGITLVVLVAIEIDERNAAPIEIEVAERSDEILIEIAGAVVNPGVYELDRGDRVVDLIDVAGGLLPIADTSALNQAAEAVDGSKVTIPFESDDTTASASPETTQPIDLNRATADELMTLPGIGAVRAQAIVDFRLQHGPFESIDALTFVDGISLALLEEIRPFVTVAP